MVVMQVSGVFNTVTCLQSPATRFNVAARGKWFIRCGKVAEGRSTFVTLCILCEFQMPRTVLHTVLGLFLL
jgi:hypothetical protein